MPILASPRFVTSRGLGLEERYSVINQSSNQISWLMLASFSGLFQREMKGPGTWRLYMHIIFQGIRICMVLQMSQMHKSDSSTLIL